MTAWKPYACYKSILAFGPDRNGKLININIYGRVTVASSRRESRSVPRWLVSEARAIETAVHLSLPGILCSIREVLSKQSRTSLRCGPCFSPPPPPNLFWQLPATGLELICECVYLRLTLPLQKIFVLRCSHLPLTLAGVTINYAARAAINFRIST